jgi:hypothetical protein
LVAGNVAPYPTFEGLSDIMEIKDFKRKYTNLGK